MLITRRTPLALAAAGLLVALSACEPPAGEDAADNIGMTEDEIGNDTVLSDDTFVVCDEDGNEYASEEAARQAGLPEAQYGATYCQM